jgi:hypothetical protein
MQAITRTQAAFGSACEQSKESRQAGPAARRVAGHLTDAQVKAQFLQAGGNPNTSIKQMRTIVHNAYVGSLLKGDEAKQPAQPGSQRALEAELTDAGGLNVAGGAAVGIGGPSRAEIEAQIARQKANAAWAARYQGLADNWDQVAYDIDLPNASKDSNLFVSIASNIADEAIGLAENLWNGAKTTIQRAGDYFVVKGPLGDGMRKLFDLTGTGRHLPATIAEKLFKGSVENAIPFLKTADEFVGIAGTTVISMVTNGWESFTDETLEPDEQWQHFTVGTGVDVGLDVVVGIVAAGIVGGVAAILVGGSVIASAPVSAVIIFAAILAAGIGIALDVFGVTDAIKLAFNDIIDNLQGEN